VKRTEANGSATPQAPPDDPRVTERRIDARIDLNIDSSINFEARSTVTGGLGYVNRVKVPMRARVRGRGRDIGGATNDNDTQ